MSARRASLRGRPRDASADEAILEATMALWAETGFERLTVEAIARRAGVAKTTLYRRWSSKTDLVLEVASMLAQREVAEPDTGDTSEDIVLFVTRVADTYTRTVAGRIVADLVGETARNAELSEAFERFWRERRKVIERVLRRGIERGDLRADLDVDHAAAVLIGPVYYRLLVTHQPIGRAFAERIVALALEGLGGDGDGS